MDSWETQFSDGSGLFSSTSRVYCSSVDRHSCTAQSTARSATISSNYSPPMMNDEAVIVLESSEKEVYI